MAKINTTTLKFETAGRDMGQIVTYSSAVTPSGAVITERHDGSDGSVEYTWRSTGRRLTPAQLRRYYLTERAAS